MEIIGILDNVLREKVNTKFGEKDKYVLILNGDKFSKFGETNLEAGMKIKLNYVFKGNFKNIESYSLVDENTPVTSNVSQAPTQIQTQQNTALTIRDKLILKQVALKGVIELNKQNKEYNLDIICADASVLYDWLLGEDY